MAGIAHHDDGVARDMARSCLEDFDKLPELASHHRLAGIFLQPGCRCRQELDEFIGGRMLQALPFLHLHILPFVGLHYISACFLVVNI